MVKNVWYSETRSRLDSEEFKRLHLGSWVTPDLPSDLINSPDTPMEVFLGNDGKIKQPLECPLSYCLCTLDRWSMPDCIPGIKSMIDITHRTPDPPKGPYRDQPTKIITVLFANNQYIHLSHGTHHVDNSGDSRSSVFLLEPEHDWYYHIVEAHFDRRGINHIEEANGPKQQTAYTSNHNPFRGKLTNAKIPCNWQGSVTGNTDATDAAIYALAYCCQQESN